MSAGRTSWRMPISASNSRRRGDCDAKTTGTTSPLSLGSRYDIRSALQPERDRSVIYELDVHHRSELAGRDGDAALTQRRHEALVQRNRRLRTSGVDEAWPPPLRGVAIERELGHDEDLSTHIGERQVHLLLGVRKES